MLNKAKFYSIGTGPGDPEYLTIKAKRILEEADIIAVPVKKAGEISTAFEIIKRIMPLENKELMEVEFLMSRDIEIRKKSRRNSVEKIQSCLDSGKTVAMITLGDVSIYSTCTYVNKALNAKGYETEIISGIPSFCAGAGKACISLCEGNETLAVVPSVEVSEKLGFIIDTFDNIVIMKVGNSIKEIYELLEARNLIDNAVIISCVGMENEIIGKISLGIEYSYFTTLIIKKGGF